MSFLTERHNALMFSSPQKRLDNISSICYTVFVNFCLISFREIYQFINTQHSSPGALGITPVRLFYQMISESNPVLSAHFREQFFLLLESALPISCPSQKIARCQKYFPFLQHPFQKN